MNQLGANGNPPPRDMSYEKGPFWRSIGIGIAILIITILVLFFFLYAVRVSPHTSLRWSLPIGTLIAWCIYWFVLFDDLWVYVEADEEVLLAREIGARAISFTDRDLTDILQAVRGLRSVGGSPGYKAKRYTESIFRRIKVVTLTDGDNLEVEHAGGTYHTVSYQLTRKTITGRYSSLSITTNEGDVKKAIKAVADAMIEQKFAVLPKDQDPRKILEKINEELDTALGADRVISDKEIKNGMWLVSLTISKIDDTIETKKTKQAENRREAFQKTLDKMSQVTGVNANLRYATAMRLIGEPVADVSVTVIEGLPAGTHFVMGAPSSKP